MKPLIDSYVYSRFFLSVNGLYILFYVVIIFAILTKVHSLMSLKLQNITACL